MFEIFSRRDTKLYAEETLIVLKGNCLIFSIEFGRFSCIPSGVVSLQTMIEARRILPLLFYL